MEILIIYYGILTAVLGAIFGSFLNCMAMRISRGEDFIQGRSHCMDCGHELKAGDLIPVISFIASRGRCRYCGKKISPRYPAAELLFMILSLLLYITRIVAVGESGLDIPVIIGFIRDWALTGCLFALSITDLETYEIPDGYIISGILIWIAGAAAEFVIYPLSCSQPLRLIDIGHHLAAGVICGGVMLLLSLIMDRLLKKESLGGGDIKLFFMLGLYMTYFGVYGLIFLSAVIGLLMLPVIKRIKNGDERVPFGPAIAMAEYILLIVGGPLEDLYINAVFG